MSVKQERGRYSGILFTPSNVLCPDRDFEGIRNFSRKFPFQAKNKSVWVLTNFLVTALLTLTGLVSFHRGIAQEIAFTQLTTSNTSCILRDEAGFIWIGTQDGLLRYDGNEFRIFRHRADDPCSMPNNFIWTIIEGREGQLWIGTFGGGLVMWDKYSETFTTFPCAPPGPDHLRENSVRSLNLAGDSLLYVGTEYGLKVFDIRIREFINTMSSVAGMPDTVGIYTIQNHLEADGLLFGTDSGLYGLVHDGARDTIIQYDLPGKHQPAVNHILSYDGNIYVATESGLFLTTDLFTWVDHLAEYKQHKVQVNEVYTGDGKHIWLATSRGLGLFSEEEGYRWYYESRVNDYSLKSGMIQCIASVDMHTLLAGSRQGVHLFSSAPALFVDLKELQYGTFNRIAHAIAEDHAGNIWIAGEEGLKKLTLASTISKSRVEIFTPRNTPGMKRGPIVYLSEDSNHDLWLVFENHGIVRMRDMGSHIQWQDYPATNAILKDIPIHQIFQDSYGDLWIATGGMGLLRFHPVEDTVEGFSRRQGLLDLNVTQISEDRSRRMWIATENGGACRYDRKNEIFVCLLNDLSNPASILSNTVHAVYEDIAGDLWISTASGIAIRDKDDRIAGRLTSVDGLPGDTVYAVVEDPNRNMWVYTREGISRMSRHDRGWHIRTFDERDGLPGYTGRRRPLFQHSSGLILLGLDSTVVMWNPVRIDELTSPPRVAITDFQIFGQSVAVNPDRNRRVFALDTAIHEVKKIVLNYDQNSLGFKFSALQYNRVREPVYAYKLVGVDADWVRTSERHFARYPNLPPGEYTFMVGIGDVFSNGSVHAVDILIRPPWWRTWWMYIVYVGFGLILFMIIFWTHGERMRAVEKAKTVERDRFREKIARDFHDDAGNKITVLSLLAERMRMEAAGIPELEKLIDDMQAQIQEFRAGMRDFIWIVDPRSDTLFEVVRRLSFFGEEICERARVEFVVQGKSRDLSKVVMTGHERRHFMLIFKEAIHNSLKHSGADRIDFIIENRPLGWLFTLRDNGKGFAIHDVVEESGLLNMKKRAGYLNSVLKIDAEPGHGTRVVLSWQHGTSLARKQKARTVKLQD